MNDIDRARWRRPAAVDAHADNHGQAPSADERKTAIEYLRGDDYSGRQSLVHAALEIAAERLYGTLLGGGPAHEPVPRHLRTPSAPHR